MILFRRATHDRDGNFLGPFNEEVENVWHSQEHPGGFIAHMLDSREFMNLDELFEHIRKYEEDHDEDVNYVDEILLALSELIRVGIVEAKEL